MDTKLKKSNKASCMLYGFTCIIEVISIAAAIISGTVFMALQEMYWRQEYTEDEYFYAGMITDMHKYNKLVDWAGGIMLAASVVSILILVVLIAMTGKYSKDEDEQYRLNWFDRLWTELHLGIGITAGVLAFLPAEYMYYDWLSGMYLGIWQWYAEYEGYRIGEDVSFALLVILELTCIGAALGCLLAVVKKIKAKEFWEKSLIGGLFLYLYRGIKYSSKTLLKVMLVAIAASLLSATWVGLPIVLILIVIFIPKLIERFDEIVTGVEEVKNGNLTYKIPIHNVHDGKMSELDKLAADVNEISQASNIAIQNELKSQRLKTDLISNVSHDLKTPLTSMVSYIYLMKKEGLDSPNAPEYLQILDEKTCRLKSLTENLFEAAKASSGAIPVNMEVIDISAILSQTLAEVDERLATKNLAVQVKNDCGNVQVNADGQLLWRVFENLLGNVSKYALEDSRVYINISEHNVGDSAMIKIEFKNISKDELNISADELMERFKRGDESRNTEGSGLGLAIAKDLTKMMRGIFEITVDGDLFKATVMLEKA